MDVVTNDDGGLLITDDEGIRHAIHPGAISSWSKLLGYTDVADTVDAIIHVARNGEPPACPETGENCWTEDYLALELIETAREAEAFKALSEGRRDDPRSPTLRATMAARAVNLGAVGATSERDSLLARCQQKARQALGVLDPKRPPTASRRTRFTCEEEPQTEDCPVRKREFCAEDRLKLKACLEGAEAAFAARQEDFCHSLTPNEENPIPFHVDTVGGSPGLALNGVEGLLARYAKVDGDA